MLEALIININYHAINDFEGKSTSIDFLVGIS